MSAFDFDVIGDPVAPKRVAPTPTGATTKAPEARGPRRRPEPATTPHSDRDEAEERPPAS